MANTTIKVNCGKENFEDAFFIRKTVFMDEQGFHDEFDGIDGISYHAVIYLDGRPVGCGRAYKDGDFAHLGRIAVLKEYRKLGLGRVIIEALEGIAKDRLSLTRLELSAQQRAIKFYEAVGFMQVGESFLDEGYPHVKMVKEI